MIKLAVEYIPPDPDKERDAWVVGCPEIDLYTQGDTYEEAAENILDALYGWFSACIEHGTLEKVLSDCGLPPQRIEELRHSFLANISLQEREVACHA